MTKDEVLKKFEFVTDKQFPEYALKEAIEKKAEIIPDLIKIVDSCADNPEEVIAKDNESEFYYFLHTFAVYLLGYFGETRAWDSFVRLIRLSNDMIDELFGDEIDDFRLTFIYFSDIDAEKIKNVIFDEKVCSDAKSIAVESLKLMYVSGYRTREKIISDFKEIFNLLKKEPNDFWDIYVSVAMDFYPEEIKDELYYLFDNNLVDTNMIEKEELDEIFTRDKFEVLEELIEYNETIKKENLLDGMKYWYLRQVPEEEEEIPEPDENFIKLWNRAKIDVMNEIQSHIPFEREHPKVGRNELCPCGSGKKYKQCHGKNQSENNLIS